MEYIEHASEYHIMSATTTDFDLSLFFDEEIETPCEGYLVEYEGYCDAVAEWLVHRNVCPGCGRNPKLLCTECKDYSLALKDQRVFCPMCNHIHTHRIYSVERIK